MDSMKMGTSALSDKLAQLQVGIHKMAGPSFTGPDLG
jgi:hypothetical protein